MFEQRMILTEPISKWPLCDALISFYSEGFPLDKAIAYAKLRQPYLVNDLEEQYILMNRVAVYVNSHLEYLFELLGALESSAILHRFRNTLYY